MQKVRLRADCVFYLQPNIFYAIIEHMQRQKVEPRTLKGFSDLGRKQTVVRDELFSKIKEIFVRYGFLPIETPTLEYRDILMNKIGEDEKLIYSFTDHGDREVAMRYDLTVPMARYVAQNMGTITFPFKRYQMQPVWRADNTQKGRSREFYQCDVDIVGSDSLTAEVEVINCLLSTLDNIGLNNSVVRISDRRLFNGFASRLSGGADMVVSLIRLVDKVYKKDNDALIEEAREHYAFFEQDCVILENVLEFIRNNKPLSELSDIVEVDQHVEATLEYIIDQVETNGFEGRIRFDLGITRGLDYYSATVWEIFIKDESLAIGCGGRYDKLLESFSDTGKPAVGGFGATTTSEPSPGSA